MFYSAHRVRGFTLIEMIVTLTILAVLAASIFPLARNTVKREKEIELSRSLRILREAIDAYKKMADEGQLEIEDLDTDGSNGYPPNLEVLVKGVPVHQEAKEGQAAAPSSPKIKKFLRRIPKDPMTDSTDWGLRSYQDDSNSDRWGGENVYDVYTKSTQKALDGTKYRDW
jgi:general secretion pathway protein G